MRLTKAVEGFLLEIQAGDYAVATVSLYQTMLKNLSHNLRDPGLGRIDPADPSRFLTWLRTEPIPTRGKAKRERTGFLNVHAHHFRQTAS